jgi:flavodoxin I
MKKKIGIFYGSTTGNTEEVAKSIGEAFGEDRVDIYDISTVQLKELEKYQYLIIGSSTWGIGGLQDDWDASINLLDEVDYSQKKVALFGTGDQEGYPDSFVDAMGTIYKKLITKNAEVIGEWPLDGYSFGSSAAVINDSFVGLAIDNDNQSGLTDERIKNWVDILKVEFC